MYSIIEIVDTVIKHVKNRGAKEALYSSYRDSLDSLKKIEDFFLLLTSRDWSQDAKNIFFKNWRSPGSGAASFCALTFRILEQAENTTNINDRDILYRCAVRISEISCEDVGVGGKNHQELYEDFSKKLSGGDSWKLDKYLIPEIKNFLEDARSYRRNGKDISHAMILSLPEELYNFGEFSFISAPFIHWHRDILKLPMEKRKSDLKFIYDHLGTTESGHFASLMLGIEEYHQVLGLVPMWSELYASGRKLIEDMALYFKKLEVCMTSGMINSDIK